jgi:hypothetical protein
MKPYGYAGEKVTMPTGEYVCTLANDFGFGSVIGDSLFKDWQVDPPKAADRLGVAWVGRCGIHLERGWSNETSLPSKRPIVEID